MYVSARSSRVPGPSCGALEAWIHRLAFQGEDTETRTRGSGNLKSLAGDQLNLEAHGLLIENNGYGPDRARHEQQSFHMKYDAMMPRMVNSPDFRADAEGRPCRLEGWLGGSRNPRLRFMRVSIPTWPADRPAFADCCSRLQV
jgi:hypothetical protein